jgi:hypothetical protein
MSTWYSNLEEMPTTAYLRRYLEFIIWKQCVCIIFCFYYWGLDDLQCKTYRERDSSKDSAHSSGSDPYPFGFTCGGRPKPFVVTYNFISDQKLFPGEGSRRQSWRGQSKRRCLGAIPQWPVIRGILECCLVVVALLWQSCHPTREQPFIISTITPPPLISSAARLWGATHKLIKNSSLSPTHILWPVDEHRLHKLVDWCTQ